MRKRLTAAAVIGLGVTCIAALAPQTYDRTCVPTGQRCATLFPPPANCCNNDPGSCTVCVVNPAFDHPEQACNQVSDEVCATMTVVCQGLIYEAPCIGGVCPA